MGRMKTKKAMKRRLARLERELTEQVEECMRRGFDSGASFRLDARFLERRHLRWVLGLKRKPFCTADVAAGW